VVGQPSVWPPPWWACASVVDGPRQRLAEEEQVQRLAEEEQVQRLVEELVPRLPGEQERELAQALACC